MPQDSFRSAVYRSFVTCDDPKGVVECRTFRKSKSNSKRLEEKVESLRKPKNLNSSSAYNKEEEKEMVCEKNVTQDLHNPSSFQLMEVSRGAQKLNQVIDSWSTGMNFDGHSKEIAKDLLKGAIDLQESLVMLGKLQEASQYMAKLKKKQKEKSKGERIDEARIERTQSHRFTDHNYQMGFQKPRLSADGSSKGERIDELGIERTNSHRFADHSYQMGLQKPRLSTDGSSKDCFEELRTAIRDSLARQNLLPSSCNEKKAYCDKRTLDSDQDIASTSSSKSSMIELHDVASSDSSRSSKAQQKSKGSNLIAKLMGLEDIPMKEEQTTQRKQLESEKISSQRRPTFEIDMPKARKPQTAAYKVTQQRKLNDIVETMQFKELLKRTSSEGFGVQSHHSNASNSKRRFAEDAPPIVIIKPLHFPNAKADDPHLQKFIQDVGALDTNEVLRKVKTKGFQPQAMDHGEEALISNEMWRRLKGHETPIKRISHGGAKNSKGVQTKSEEFVVKTNDKLSSNKLKASVPVIQQQKKKEIVKKVDKIQKVTQRRKKPVEMENVKSKPVYKSHDQAKVTSAKERKPEIGSITTKNRVSHRKSTTSNVISENRTPSISHNCGDRKKNLNNDKPVEEPLAANLLVENVECKHGEELIDVSCEIESDITSTSTTTADQLHTKEETDTPETQIEDQCYSSQNSHCHVISQTTQLESYSESAEEAKYCISDNSSEKECLRTVTNAKDLFLSSPSFLSYAEVLFDIEANRGIVPQTISLDDFGIADTRLLLDCANELMQHKSLRSTQTIHPLLINHLRSSNTVSLTELVDEVCSGIEILRSYRKLTNEKCSTDGHYAVMERDLKCKGVMSGGWDLGWRPTFTVDEVEQVVGELEKLVFSGLMEDMFTDFLL